MLLDISVTGIAPLFTKIGLSRVNGVPCQRRQPCWPVVPIINVFITIHATLYYRLSYISPLAC